MRDAVLAFARETQSRCADSARPFEHGVVLDSPALDAVWSVNTLIFTAPEPSLSFDDLVALMEERFAGRRYASAVFEDERTGDRMAAAAQAIGWRVDRELYMELRRPPDRVVDTAGVQEGDEEEVLALMRAWNEEELASQGAETLRQLGVFAEREWRARPARIFVAGDASATCRLWEEDGIAQVEAVYTSPAARGRGYARMLLTHALLEARAGDPELVFIVADDDDTPKELYARLGFDPLVRVTRVVRGA